MARRTMFGAVLGVLAAVSFAAWFLRPGKEPPDPPTSAVRRITLAYNRDTPLVSPVFVSLDRKLWADESLDVDPQGLLLGRACLDAVLAGHSDFGTVAETPIVFAALRGIDFKILCTFATSTEHVRCAARGVSRPEELKGKKVATAIGTNNEYYMDRFLETHGLGRQDVEVINLNPTEMMNALIAEQVDAVFCFEPFLSKAKERLGADLTIFPPGNFYTVTYSIVAKSELIRDRPELVNGVLRTLLHSADYLKEHRQESIAIVAKQLGLEEGFLAGIWDAYHFEVALRDEFLQTLDEETAWARKRDPSLKDSPPVDFRKLFAEGPLQALKPDAVRVNRP